MIRHILRDGDTDGPGGREFTRARRTDTNDSGFVEGGPTQQLQPQQPQINGAGASSGPSNAPQVQSTPQVVENISLSSSAGGPSELSAGEASEVDTSSTAATEGSKLSKGKEPER